MTSVLSMLSYEPATGIQIGFMAVIVSILLVSTHMMEEILVDGYRKAKNGDNGYVKNRLYMTYREHPAMVDNVHIVMVVALIAAPFIAWAAVGFMGLILIVGFLLVTFSGSLHRINTVIEARLRQRLKGQKFMLREYMRLAMLSGAGTEDIDELLKKRVEFLLSSHSNSPHLTPSETDEVLRLLAADSDTVGFAAKRLLDSHDYGSSSLT